MKFGGERPFDLGGDIIWVFFHFFLAALMCNSLNNLKKGLYKFGGKWLSSSGGDAIWSKILMSNDTFTHRGWSQ